MSFSIPAIQTTDLTAAAISTRVWLDKEVIAALKTTFDIFNIAPPTLNTLHEVFHETDGCELFTIRIVQTNTPTNAEDVDIVVTVDGVVYIYDASDIGALTNGTEYTVNSDLNQIGTLPTSLDITAGLKTILALDTGHTLPLKGHNVKLEIRQTSAIAAAASISVKYMYRVPETL